MERETSILTAGLSAAIAFPVCALALGLPLWLSAIVAAGVFGGLALALKSRGFGLDAGEMQEAQSETVSGLISDGSTALDRLQRALAAIRDPAMKSAVQQLATTAGKVLSTVRGDPGRAMAVRRLLTFYLPNAAAITEGWQTLERAAVPSPERMAQTRDVVSALGDAFKRFENEADAPELQELDLNLKVVKDSLKSDLEKVA